MGKASFGTGSATDGKHEYSCSVDCACSQRHSTRSAFRSTDSAGAPAEDRGCCFRGNISTRGRQAEPARRVFGPADKGTYTIWLVGFGNTWIPVLTLEADSWYVAREKGERIFSWVPRGWVDASSGNQLSTFVENAETCAAQYAARQRLSRFMSRNAPIPPHHQTLIRFAGYG